MNTTKKLGTLVILNHNWRRDGDTFKILIDLMIQNLRKERSFDVTTVTKTLTALDFPSYGTATVDRLRCFHCVDYDSMDQRTLDLLAKTIEEAFHN